MIVKTRNPIRTVNVNVKPNASFSYADDAKGKTDKKAKTGFFSKSSRTERKANRQAKYGSRPLKGFLKAGKQYFKDNLPKLKKKANGKFEKTLADGTQAEIDAANALVIATEAAKKATADAAAKQAVSDAAAKKAADTKNASDAATADAAKKAADDAARKAAEESAKQPVVDKKDVDPNTKIDVDANGNPTQDIPKEKTEEAVDDKGQVQTYKKSDVVDKGSEETKKPMSTLVKVGLGVGAVAVLGVIIYLIVRPKK
jgi:cobalamin biosynthesis Mg chelatase CobN